jgi:hypothetical protein
MLIDGMVIFSFPFSLFYLDHQSKSSKIFSFRLLLDVRCSTGDALALTEVVHVSSSTVGRKTLCSCGLSMLELLMR